MLQPVKYVRELHSDSTKQRHCFSFLRLFVTGWSVSRKRDTAGSTTTRISRYHYLSVILNNLWTF